MYKTRVLVEIEYLHQFDPKTSYENIVQDRLKCPAVSSVKLVGMESDFKLHSKPMDKMAKIDNLNKNTEECNLSGPLEDGLLGDRYLEYR